MFDNILVAAFWGAIGGGAGATLGYFISAKMKVSGNARWPRDVIVGGLAALGAVAAKPVLEPVINKLLGNADQTKVVPAKISDQQVSQIMTGLKSDPLVTALLLKQPQLEAEAEEKLSKAYAEGGLRALTKASVEFGASIASNYLKNYFLRASDEDLVRAVTAMDEAVHRLAELDPKTCYAWQFAAYGHEKFNYPALIQHLGEDRYQAHQEALAAVVTNASDSVPEYDVEAGRAVTKRAGIAMLAKLDPEKYDLINGRLAPASVADEKAACEALAAMYDVMLKSENPAAALRYMFSLTVK